MILCNYNFVSEIIRGSSSREKNPNKNNCFDIPAGICWCNVNKRNVTPITAFGCILFYIEEKERLFVKHKSGKPANVKYDYMQENLVSSLLAFASLR